jgi:hypothetical protein
MEVPSGDDEFSDAVEIEEPEESEEVAAKETEVEGHESKEPVDDFNEEDVILLKELRSVVEVPAGKMHKLQLTLEEGDFVWWRFKGFNFFMSGDIGFAVKKKFNAPNSEPGGEDSVMYNDLPWNGQNSSYRYSSASTHEGLWGPALQKCEVVLVWVSKKMVTPVSF